MQHMLVALQYQEASSYSILIKYYYLNFIPWMPGTVAPSPPLVHAPDFMLNIQLRKLYMPRW